MKILRIAFCILACLCLAASILLGIFFGILWFLVAIAAAALFALCMFFCKKRSEPAEAPPAAGYFENEEQREEK